MGDRSLLGSADVPDDVLAGMVADLLGHDCVDLGEVCVEPVEYDVPSLTTIGRFWVTGTARTPRGDQQYRMFVKHVQAWHHSPWFQQVPEDVRDFAAASYPWRIEAAVYASDLRRRLPDGLAMPRALGILDREPDSVVLWVEAVDHVPQRWDAERFERAAYLLGAAVRQSRRGRARRRRGLRLVGDDLRRGAGPARPGGAGDERRGVAGAEGGVLVR